MRKVPLTPEKQGSEEIPQSKNAENTENADTKTRKMRKMRMTGFNVTGFRCPILVEFHVNSGRDVPDVPGFAPKPPPGHFPRHTDQQIPLRVLCLSGFPFQWNDLDERQITHLVCARLKYGLCGFFWGCFGAFCTRKAQEAGPKQP